MTGWNKSRSSLILAGGLVLAVGAMAFAGGHTWDLNELFSNAAGNIQFIELRESGGGAGEVAVTGHVISTLTAPAHSYTMPGPNVTPPTSFKTLLFATPDCAALPGFPTPNYILNAAPFFSVVNDTVTGSGWPPPMTYVAGGLPTNGYHSRNAIGPVIACATPRNYAGTTVNLNLACSMLGDVNSSGGVDGDDIAGFVRVILNTPDVSDNAACTEYCLGSIAANTDAFINSLVN